MNNDVKGNLWVSLVSVVFCGVLGLILDLLIKNTSASLGEAVCSLGVIVHVIVLIVRINKRDKVNYKNVKLAKKNEKIDCEQVDNEKKVFWQKNYISFGSIVLLVALSLAFFFLA